MKTVLITGATKGVGGALAEKFLKEGCFVIGTYFHRNHEMKDPSLVLIPLDLSKEEGINECVEEIKKLGKKIDILINNAGVLLDEEETRVIPAKLRDSLEVNLIGTISFTEKIIPIINLGGHIVNISSTAGSLELATEEKSHFPGHYPSYKISKAALNMYTVTLSNQLKDMKIVVSSVHPGWVKTDMGGEEADLTPEEAAESIYKFTISHPETGGFWFNGKRVPW